MVLSTIFFGLIMAVFGWFLPFIINSKIANAWGITNSFLLRFICGLTYSVEGLENLPENSACIIMSKHQSAWETITFRGIFPANQAWVLKRELMFIPIFGWALAVVQPIAINRKAGREAMKQVVEQGLLRLSQNRNVIIFPEGTRVAPGERKRYGAGGSLLAAKADVPVIPVAHNAGVFWKRRGLNKYPGNIQVVIGPAINTKGMSASEINQNVEEWIESEMDKLPSRLSE
ncbi:MAG: lysophospholipid acyltransferase family protein [Eudoraea sp.]|nr:lysophospholipid acyltransferase family protein [Eudoraea sp.]